MSKVFDDDDVFTDEDQDLILSSQADEPDEKEQDKENIPKEDIKTSGNSEKPEESKPDLKEESNVTVHKTPDNEMSEQQKVNTETKLAEIVEKKVDTELPSEKPVEEKAETKAEEKEESLPPPPPKRSSQTNQRLKRWSKMIKHSLPNKLPKAGGSSNSSQSSKTAATPEKSTTAAQKQNGSPGKDRKSLKDKVMEGELAVFLKERRAVSESRFRLLDKLTTPGNSRPPLPRTKSIDNIKKNPPRYIGKVRRSPSRNRNWGHEIQVGTLSNLKEKFEIKSASSSPTRADLRSPSLLKEMLASQERINEFGSRGVSPASKNGGPHRLSSEERQANIKKMQVTVTVHPAVQSLVDDEKDYQDTSTTSPESGQEDQKQGDQDVSSKKKKMTKEAKNESKKEKKDKKEKKKHSTCEACNSDREHKEHKKEKKRAKKEKEKKEKAPKKVTIMNGEKGSVPNGKAPPGVPPYPKVEDYNWSNINKGGFFKKLLIHDDEPDGSKKSHLTTEERKSRPRKCKSPVTPLSKPSLNAYLKEKKVVSDSKFKKEIYQSPTGRNLPPGVILGQQFFENRSKFESGMTPVAKFPRSFSNLERRTAQTQDASAKEQNESSEHVQLPSRSVSAMSHRSVSLPRPASAFSHHSEQSLIDHEEYKNYMLEMIHSTQKNARFQQLQSYYNILDRAKQLEKKSSSMEIHKLRSDEVIDFETWRKLRQKEKAKDELHMLMKNLRQAQKERQFHFCPKEIEDVRWKGDIRLRGRDKSVENLRNHFALMAGQDKENKNRQEINEQKDMYLPLWRAKSVTSVANKMQQNQKQTSSKSSVGKLGENKFTTFPQVRSGKLPGRSRSSLTNQQVNILKDQLKGIYETGPGSKPSISSSLTSSEKLDSFEVSVNTTKLGDVKKQLELQNLFVKPLPQVVQQSRRQMHKNRSGQNKSGVSRESSAEERQRLEVQKTMSLKIGQELLERSSGNSGLKFDMSDRRRPIKFCESEDQVPRTCYSLENGDANPCQDVHDEEDDFLLVLTDADSDEHQEKEVKNIVENWASGDEGGKSGRRKRHFSGKKSAESLVSSSSGKTDNTVVHRNQGRKDMQDQPKSFEELKKSFENVSQLHKSEEDLKNKQNLTDLTLNLSVKSIRKSFEKINDQESLEASLPKAPARSSSFYRAKYISKRNPSPSGDHSLPRKMYGAQTMRSTDRQRFFTQLERSLSNPDFSDTEGAPNSKTNFPYQNGSRYVAPSSRASNSSLLHLAEVPHVTKYSRAYLSLVKNGDVYNKRSKFEDVGERSSIPARAAAKLYRMPDFSPDFVSKHLTDTSKVVIKTKEIADTNKIRRKLEEKAGHHQQQPLQQQQQQHQSQEMTGSTFNLHSKDKLKHLCKKIGHSKILGKMVALQCASNTEVDEGTTKLWNKATNEEEYLNVYRAGGVDSKVKRFEPAAHEHEDVELTAEEQLPQWAGKGGKYSFSWSKRFGSHLPAPVDSYTNAQKHNQFRKYYGYHPADNQTDRRSTSPQRKGDLFQSRTDEPLSLPTELVYSSLEGPPRPPERKYLTISSHFEKRHNNETTSKTDESIYGKILPKSQRSQNSSADNTKGALSA